MLKPSGESTLQGHVDEMSIELEVEMDLFEIESEKLKVMLVILEEIESMQEIILKAFLELSEAAQNLNVNLKSEFSSKHSQVSSLREKIEKHIRYHNVIKVKRVNLGSYSNKKLLQVTSARKTKSQSTDRGGIFKIKIQRTG